MKRYLIAVALIIGVLIAPNLVQTNVGASATKAKSQIIVKFKNDQLADTVLKQHGLANGPVLGSTGARLISVPKEAEDRVIIALSKNSVIEYAERDEPVFAATADTYFDRQYALYNIGQSFTNTTGSIDVQQGVPDADIDAQEAWAYTQGAGVKVAVLDSGVDTNHEDISADLRANFTADTDEDAYGHGTHVSGIIAAKHNEIGVAGVCPGCVIMSAKVLDDDGIGSTSSIVQGIDWAVQNGAKVINMSIGSRSTRTLESAVNNAWNQGTVLVAAAGNSGNRSKLYPAAYTNVIAVAATDNKDLRASFSNYDAKWVDIAAPGENIYSTFPNHSFVLRTKYGRSINYDIANGTSMSSPMVAAAAAMVWSTEYGTTNTAVRSRVQQTADKISGTGTLWANGRLNVESAVKPSL